MTITDGYDYFLSCVESLSPVFFEVEEHLLSKQQEEIWMKHKIYLEWIPEPHLSVSACICKWIKIPLSELWPFFGIIVQISMVMAIIVIRLYECKQLILWRWHYQEFMSCVLRICKEDWYWWYMNQVFTFKFDKCIRMTFFYVKNIAIEIFSWLHMIYRQ